MQKTKWVQTATAVENSALRLQILFLLGENFKLLILRKPRDLLECKQRFPKSLVIYLITRVHTFINSDSTTPRDSEINHEIAYFHFQYFSRILTSPVNLQVSSPSSGWVEDSGRNKEERQRQPPQRHPHEGVLLLPQSPLHLLWASWVSILTCKQASMNVQKLV